MTQPGSHMPGSVFPPIAAALKVVISRSSLALVSFATGVLLGLPLGSVAAEGGSSPDSATTRPVSIEAVPVKTPYGYDYFKLRNGLDNCRVKFEREKKGRVVFLGGSITAAPGSWHGIVADYLKNKFPDTQFEFVNAGIPSMGSTPHSFRFTRDVLKNGPVDLLFVEAAVNDELNLFPLPEVLRGMEGVVRQARLSNPAMDIAMLHFEDYRKIPVYNAGKTPAVIECHEKVADYYGVPSIDMAKEMAERERAGEFNWQKDFSGIHPNAFGAALFARSIIRMLDAAWKGPLPENAKMKACPMPDKPLDEKSYFRGKLVSITEATLGDGWSIVPDWTPDPGDKAATRPGFVNVASLVSEKPGSTFRLKFSGTAVGLFMASGLDVGNVEFSVDGGPFVTKDLWTAASKGYHIPWAFVLSADLVPGNHEVTVKVAEKSNPQSTGTAVRIMHFLVN